jgi:hypothetical protein
VFTFHRTAGDLRGSARPDPLPSPAQPSKEFDDLRAEVEAAEGSLHHRENDGSQRRAPAPAAHPAGAARGAPLLLSVRVSRHPGGRLRVHGRRQGYRH